MIPVPYRNLISDIYPSLNCATDLNILCVNKTNRKINSKVVVF